MLRRLEVEHLAILEGLALEFGPGLNVLTGETGAGKSLLLDALQLALGARGEPGLIRQGQRALRVTALFEPGEASEAARRVAELGVPPDDGTLLLWREVAREGRGTARINGQLVTASVLREAGSHLLTLAGQGEHHRFAQPSVQLDYLDGFADAQRCRQSVAEAYAAWREAQAARARLGGDPGERLRRRDLLAFEVAEIDALGLAPDEDERLAAERQALGNAERLKAAVEGGVDALWEGEGAVRDRLGLAGREIAAAARLDGRLAEAAALIEQAAVATDEAARALRRYGETVSLDPAALAAVEERWNRVQQCKRKFGPSVAEVAAYRERAAAELGELEAGEERAARLGAELDARGQALAACCADLSRLRAAAAVRLTERLSEQLADLGMAGARLQVELSLREDPEGVPCAGRRLAVGDRGWDQIQMLWTANAGETAQPLGRVASGGELARVLLAMHALRAESVGVPTVVFDEVDAGVGGRAAAAVAQRLRLLGAGRQVLCVTHLAVIAAAADRHFVIEKQESGGRTATRVRALEGPERVAEVARMLDGGRGAASGEHAADLLRRLGRQGDVPEGRG